MEKLIAKIKDAKIIWGVIVGLITFIASSFMIFHTFLSKYEGTLDMIKTTQQMALKSVIWNDEIPLPERVSACDTYLNAGYNSLTKKECEVIIEKGADSGIFSYLESEVKKDGNNLCSSNSNNSICLWGNKQAFC